MKRTRPRTAPSAAAKPLTDDVCVRIRALILTNRLRPRQKLVDRDLAEQLGVSRTPVREALARLAMTGLVEARSRRGYYVAQIGSEQMSELYEFRKILEVAAARLAAANATADHHRRMEQILGRLEKLALSADAPDSPGKAVTLDLEIHNLIADASGNAPLRTAIHTLLDKVVAFIWADWLNVSIAATPEEIVDAEREHKVLLRSILAKDAEGAARLMGAHLDSARKGLEGMIRNRAGMESGLLSVR